MLLFFQSPFLLLQLLQDIVADVRAPVGADNPLRQVIINTHSPAVVAQVPEDSLLVAELKEAVGNGPPFKRLSFSCLPKTWRHKTGEPAVSRGTLLGYLNPVSPREAGEDLLARRVVDHPDLQMLLPFGAEG